MEELFLLLSGVKSNILSNFDDPLVVLLLHLLHYFRSLGLALLQGYLEGYLRSLVHNEVAVLLLDWDHPVEELVFLHRDLESG